MMTVGVNAIVVKDGKILLIKRKDVKIWALPGGIVEEKESFEKAVVREVKEETNIDIKPERITGVYIRTIPFLEDVVFAYKCRYTGSDIGISKESPEVRWFAKEQAFSEAPEFVTTIIKDAFSYRNKLMVRKINRYEVGIVLRFLKSKIKKRLFTLAKRMNSYSQRGQGMYKGSRA